MPGAKSLKELFEQHERSIAHLPKPPKIVYDPSKFGAPSQMRFSGASLNPYTGPWTRKEASHLLRRTVHGFKAEDVSNAVQLGLSGSMSILMDMGSMPTSPLNAFFNLDSAVPIDQPWAYKRYNLQLLNQIRNYRVGSTAAWTMGLLLNHNFSLREKMTLFWHNHFPVANIQDANLLYQYSQLIRQYATGNFKDLVKAMTINPAMMEFLNSDQNRVQAPNENYARELLELFTVGKGDLAGPGDYSTFTEEDVAAIAKVLTGWIIIGRNSPVDLDDRGPYAQFRAGRHDTSTKTLSHRFNNAEISNGDDSEYDHLIDIIFEQEEVSKFICRKLYRWFVYYIVDDDVELSIIEPMAQTLRDNNYEIAPVIEMLLMSEHFYDINLRGAMIKNPINFALDMLNQFDIYEPTDIQTSYEWWGGNATYFLTAIIQMAYYNPPDVAGWKAYYQEPVFYQIWINSVTLPFRRLITDVFSVVGPVINPTDNPDVGTYIRDAVIIDGIAAMEAVSVPSDVNVLIMELGDLMHPRSLTELQILQLKQILIPGLPDFEWTDEYFSWKADPENEELLVPIRNKIRFLLRTLMIMPEYYLS